MCRLLPVLQLIHSALLRLSHFFGKQECHFLATSLQLFPIQCSVKHDNSDILTLYCKLVFYKSQVVTDRQ